MTTGRLGGVIRHLHRAALLHEAGHLTDGQLLEHFLTGRDEAAFEALVRRHGPMVLGVCRRVLRNIHDAEDAFQATFLVLVRKAASVVPRELVANWLYGVAYRTALGAKTANARRRAKEREMPQRAAPEEDVWDRLRPLLDHELSHLPERYRVPVVLCDLEGKSRKEAARQLGWPEGTLSGRLARARVLLARRLAARGLALSGGALAAALAPEAALAGVPAPLLGATVRAATLLAAGQAAAGVVPAKVALLVNGVLRAMVMTKLKIVTTWLLAVGVVGGGVGLWSAQAQVAAQSSAHKDAPAGRRAGPLSAVTFVDSGTVAERVPPRLLEPPDVLDIHLSHLPRAPMNLPEGFLGMHLVRPDGTLGLGGLGSLAVEGKTLDQVKDALVAQLERQTKLGCSVEQFKQGLELSIMRAASPTPGQPAKEGLVEEIKQREYVVECVVVKVKATPGDTHTQSVESSPQLCLLEGQEATCSIGQDRAVPADGGGAAEVLPTGISLRVKVRGFGADKMCVEATYERTDVDRADKNGWQVQGRMVRTLARVKLGEAVKLEEKNERGEVRRYVVVRVVKEVATVARTRAAPADSRIRPNPTETEK